MRPVRHLVLFARWPQLGTGKRRLAKDIGAVPALRFQRATLALILRRIGRDARWQTWLAVTPDRSGPWPRPFLIVAQGHGDLGCRMASVSRRLPAGPVVIVGTDVPGIRAEHIAHAFHALGGHDAVFGPASDGGFWLVGLRRRPRLLVPFRDVRWSSRHALADTLSNLAGRKFALLETLTDVDDGASFFDHRHGSRSTSRNADD